MNVNPNGKPLISATHVNIINSRSSDHILSEESFLRMVAVERKRTDRSRRSFILMLLKYEDILREPNADSTINRIWSALEQSTRGSDLKGWYRLGSIFGVIFTEFGESELTSIIRALHTKVEAALASTLTAGEVQRIRTTIHVYPEDPTSQGPGAPADLTLYPDATNKSNHLTEIRIKRLIDIVGSLAGLILAAPLLIVAAALIKLTSTGPILFKQVRLGQYGKHFNLLKLRSMYSDSDSTVHRKYVEQLISGHGVSHASGGCNGAVYKLVADRRVTTLGKILRKTSLDELPQLINVLKGEMSLVGPRPPIPYEFEAYRSWHRTRLVVAKPGITGLWQVGGRSAVSFDDMVRLDLRYAIEWSLWLDFKILLKTPFAVLSGIGAY